MEANFNLGSLKIVHTHLTEYLKKSIENISGNINLITVEKKHPTDFSSIEMLAKSQRTLEMIGLNGLACVLVLIEKALTKVKAVEYDTKTSVEILNKTLVLTENSLAYLNRLVTSSNDQPTVFFDLYSDLASKIGIGSNIKDLFFPKLEFRPEVPTGIKQQFKNSIIITDSTKSELINAIESNHLKMQELLPNCVKVYDSFGTFSSEQEEHDYSSKISSLSECFKNLQDLKINKTYFCLFGIYQLYLSIINPLVNPTYRKFVADNSDNIKNDLIQTERTLARLLNNVIQMEIGEKTSSLLIDDLSIKDLLFDLCYFIHTISEIKDIKEYKSLYEYFDIESYVSQLFDVAGVDTVLSQSSISDIVSLFNESRDYFNLLSNDVVGSNDFKIHNSKFLASMKKIGTISSKVKSFNQLILELVGSSEKIQNNPDLFTNDVKTEISLALVAIDFAINNYFKNELFENLNRDFGKEAQLIISRVHLALYGDFVKLRETQMPQLDNVSLKVQEEQTFSQLFSQIQVEIDKVEETLDYFLRNDGENLDELDSIQKPLSNLKGIFAIVGDYELLNIISNISSAWTHVFESKKFSLEELQQSISLLSGISLLVKAYANGNLVEAEELQRGLLKIYYKQNSNMVPQPEPIVLDKVEVPVESKLEFVIENNELTDLKIEENLVNKHLESKEELLDFDLSLELPSFIETKVEDKVDNHTASVESLDIIEHDIPEITLSEVVIDSVGGKYTESTNDPDIAEVFLMEADEVLESLDKELVILHDNITDSVKLSDVRRMFHTLKGSGRMVGLEFMGEAAWMVEQTLNKCLSGELVLNGDVIDFAAYVAEIFKEGVNSLKTHNSVTVDLPSIKRVALSVNPGITNHVEIDDVVTLPSDLDVTSDNNKTIDVQDDISTSGMTSIEAEVPEQVVELDIVLPVSENTLEDISLVNNDIDVNTLDVHTEPLITIESTNNLDLSAETSEVEAIVDVVVDHVEPAKKDIYVDGSLVSGTLYDLFMEESSEHIASLKEFANRDFSHDVIIKEEDMRHAHTLASIAASVNMGLVSELSSKLEDILILCLDKDIALSQTNLNPIRHAVENLDLLRTTDSSSYVSYCDGLIENLNSLHDELLENVSRANVKTEQVHQQIDIAELTKTLISSISQSLDEKHKAIISELNNRNRALSEQVETMSNQIVELSESLSAFKNESVEREKVINRTIDVAKNDIRVMANIVKKKSERIEAISAEENLQSEEVEDLELDKISDSLDLSDDQLNDNLGLLVSESEQPSEENGSTAISTLFEKYPHIKVIFEDKVGIVVDEIEDELYELSKIENEEILEKVSSIVDSIGETGLAIDNNRELKRFLHTIKGGSRMAGANKMGMLMHRLESLMDFIESRDLNIYEIKPILVSEVDKANFLLKNGRNSLTKEQKNWLDSATDSENTDELSVATTTNNVVAKESTQFIRVPADVVDSAITDAGEIRLTRTSLENINNNNKKSVVDLKSSSDKLLKMVKEVEIQAESQIKARKDLLDSSSSDFDPLEFDRFTRLQELTRFMNETVLDIHESIVGLEGTSKVQDAAVSQQSIVSNNLLSELMKVRLVPFESIVDRFYKIARNTAKEINKKVSLEIFGEKTELDKIILDKIVSPVEHLLRNSIAHGIESQDLRTLSGKNPIGNISIDILQEGNSTIIKLSDDGAGINVAKIHEAAINKGLIKTTDVLSDDETINLIFQSGFSTAETVSQISGRGVGMDVVKNDITSLGGTVKIETTAGVGTTFILTIPMSIATNQCILSFVRDKLVAIPAILVEKIGSFKENQIKEAYQSKKVTIDGKSYDFMYAGHLLGLVDTSVLPDMKTYNNYLLIKYVDEYLVVHVDRVSTTSEVLIKALGAQYAKIDGILGATVLGDGQQGLVINPVLIQKYFKTIVSKIVEVNIDSKSSNKGVSRTTVMVVDDSITVRRATTKVLERNNFHVILAKDGEDALEQLQISTPDIILSDIEMPRMDGFEFVKNVRNIPRYNNIPVMMITSRTADKHKNYAFELGANDFIGKPYKEEELVEKINVLLDKFKEIQ